jgi:UDP-N-acetylglucosamine transferase subunit ALG13
VILVTVGTTMPFDELLEEVDRLAGAGALGEDVLCQSGHSSYRMAHGEQFVGRPTLHDLMDESSLVITHGGSTVIQLLLMGKPFVAFPNPRGAGDHQTNFLAQISEVADVSWSRDVRDLGVLLKQRRRAGAARLRTAFPHVADEIRMMLSR